MYCIYLTITAVKDHQGSQGLNGRYRCRSALLVMHVRKKKMKQKTFYGCQRSLSIKQKNDYLRKVLRSPACVMATSVLVTEVPMLVPMMMGTASWTVSTAKAQRFPSSLVVPLPLHTSNIVIIHPYVLWVYVCVVWRLVLTSRRDHADNYGGGSGGALDQQGDQDTDDQTSQRICQNWVVLKYVTCCFAWTR